MISDVLYDAIQDIRTYQEHVPAVYEEMHFEIEVVVAQMDLLRNKLDTCPAIAQAETKLDVDVQVLTGESHDEQGTHTGTTDEHQQGEDAAL